MLGLGLEFSDSARVRVRVMIKGECKGYCWSLRIVLWLGLGFEFRDSVKVRVRV